MYLFPINIWQLCLTATNLMVFSIEAIAHVTVTGE